jgi:hypothetical protein
LAVPRLAGGPASRAVEDLLIDVVQRLGYQVTATRFVAHSPLDAVAVLGAGLGWLALLLVPLLALPLPNWSAALFLAVSVLVLGVVGWGLVRDAIPNPRLRAEARNIEGRRGEPRVWLVAHSDSKGQGLSLRGRVVAVLGAATGIIVLLVLVFLRFLGPVHWAIALGASLPAMVAGALLSRSKPRDDSPGAVDNASGIIAALTAAELLRTRPDVGILITSAEEFAMAGARVWAAETARQEPFVNFDGIDARGPVRVMSHGDGAARRREARALAEAIRAEVEEAGAPVRVAPLPPGVLVDGTVLGRAGMPGVTVSRGDWTTLGVVHTAGDTADRTDPAAAVAVGTWVASALSRRLG